MSFSGKEWAVGRAGNAGGLKTIGMRIILLILGIGRKVGRMRHRSDLWPLAQSGYY
jgi:hypothetical protein